MPQPTSSQVHVDAILTRISVGFQQSQADYIADRIFPVVPVEKQTDKYFVYDRQPWFRDQMRRRPPGTPSAGSGMTLSTDTYSCDIWALHRDIDDPTRANADSPINLDADTSRWLTGQGLLRREIQWASDFFTLGKWATDAVGGVGGIGIWSDEAGSDPVEDIKNGRLSILKKTGYLPNTMVVGIEVHEALKKHPLILERYKYTSSDSISEGMLARLFEVDRYFVAKAVYDTANELAAANMSFVFGKNALLCYAAPAPGLMVPSAGYTFVWRALTGLNNLGTTLANFRMQELKSDRIEIEMAFDLKKVAADLGYFFSVIV